MKQVLILSGKGGSGKTTVAGALIRLSQAKNYADCDVDAPNLHLIFHEKETPQHTDYFGLPKMKIDPEKCIRCGTCKEACRFDAIGLDGVYFIRPYACEGCGVCEYVCPAMAISKVPTPTGSLNLYKNNDRVFSTACLYMGSGNSGKLVSAVKSQLKEHMLKTSGESLVIVDGSPGIGCPVIASISGADMVLMVTEPTLSGWSDLKRVIRTAEQFRTPVAVCINKHDINPELTEKIISWCSEHEIAFLGGIPYDVCVSEAINQEKSIVDFDCPASAAVQMVYERLCDMLFCSTHTN